MGRIEKKGEKQFVVHFKTGDAEHSLECGMVLFGTGRKPNTDRLNLQVRALAAEGLQWRPCPSQDSVRHGTVKFAPHGTGPILDRA